MNISKYLYVFLILCLSIHCVIGSEEKGREEDVELGPPRHRSQPNTVQPEHTQIEIKYGRSTKAALYFIGLGSLLPVFALFKNSYYAKIFADTSYYNTWTAYTLSGFAMGQVVSNVLTSQYLPLWTSMVQYKELILCATLFIIGSLCIAVSQIKDSSLSTKAFLGVIVLIAGLFGITFDLVGFCVNHMTWFWPKDQRGSFSSGSAKAKSATSMAYVAMSLILFINPDPTDYLPPATQKPSSQGNSSTSQLPLWPTYPRIPNYPNSMLTKTIMDIFQYDFFQCCTSTFPGPSCTPCDYQNVSQCLATPPFNLTAYFPDFPQDPLFLTFMYGAAQHSGAVMVTYNASNVMNYGGTLYYFNAFTTSTTLPTDVSGVNLNATISICDLPEYSSTTGCTSSCYRPPVTGPIPVNQTGNYSLVAVQSSAKEQRALAIYYYVCAAISYLACLAAWLLAQSETYTAANTILNQILNEDVTVHRAGDTEMVIVAEEDYVPAHKNKFLLCTAPTCKARVRDMANLENSEMCHQIVFRSGSLRIATLATAIMESMSILIMVAVIPNMGLSGFLPAGLFAPLGYLINCFFSMIGGSISGCFLKSSCGFCKDPATIITVRLISMVSVAAFVPLLFFCYYAQNPNVNDSYKLSAFSSELIYIVLLASFSFLTGVGHAVLGSNEDELYSGAISISKRTSISQTVFAVGRALGCFIAIVVLVSTN